MLRNPEANTKSGSSFFTLIVLCVMLPVCFLNIFSAQAQNACPPNIDFENGNFNGWTCYTGNTSTSGNQNVITLFPSAGPVSDHHTMFSAATSAGALDYYGNFPVMCPNGSGYSVKLGNNLGGAEAEGISYEFTIPSNRNTYSLIYHYAVVFQDPNHLDYQQPRLVLEVTNETDKELITCSSFTFFPNGSPLPGFFISPNSDSTTVWCKDWSAVTINLNNKAGKTIKLFFKTADCTFRRHFGYAYVDVNTECSSEFVGATFCRDDTAVNVVAPYGYQNYTWFNSNFSQVLGTTQTINFTPPPPVGTQIAVEIIPYNGYGCQDTLYAKLVDTLTLRANAGIDNLSCNQSPVIIGENPKQGVIYNWTPATDLSSVNIANPRASPAITTNYELTVRSRGGGCVDKDTVLVTASVADSSMQLLGKTSFCITTGDSAVLLLYPADSIQWYRDNSALMGANGTRLKIIQSGSYSATVFTDEGCSLSTRTEQIVVETPRPPINYPLQYAVVNNPVQLQARTFGTSVLWRPPTYLDNETIVNPQFNSPLSDEEFIYTIRITTASGCVTVDTQIVKTIKEVKIYVPSAFTPNNDGLNDFLKPIMLGVKELQYFRIYNRWGQLVYDMRNGSQQGWDGKISGQPQATNVYVWIIQALGLDNKIHVRKGTVTIIR